MFRWKGSLFIETHVKGRNKPASRTQTINPRASPAAPPAGSMPWRSRRPGQPHMETSLGSLCHPFPVGDEGTSGLGGGSFLSVPLSELAAASSAQLSLSWGERSSAPTVSPFVLIEQGSKSAVRGVGGRQATV